MPHRSWRNLQPSGGRAALIPGSATCALQLMTSGHRGASVVSFDDLGVFEILADAKDPDTVQRFVRTWLGALLDYDEIRSAELVRHP